MKLTFMNSTHMILIQIGFIHRSFTRFIYRVTISALLMGILTGCQSKPPSDNRMTQVDPVRLHQQMPSNIKPNMNGVEPSSGKNGLEDNDAIQKIAVLLAESGRFKPASTAIRQGILLSYYQQAQLGNTSELMFLDAAESPITTLYQQAVAAGATVIIGPLDKDQVKQLAGIPNITTPILALNYLPESMPVASNQLFQFGLATEDEARQISIRGQQLGYRRAALLYPQNEWGQRVATAFRDDWQQHDGRISSERSYVTAAGTDYSDPVRSLLGIHKETREDGQSQQVRRQDIDFIVMISDPKAARQLKPMLNYYFADNLSVFSTSNIFAGIIDPNKDQDINGVQFTELPWLLDTSDALRHDYGQQPSATNISTHADTLRLVALGIDSFRIAPRLTWLHAHADNSIDGATGKLTLNPARRIQRQSAWAHFQNGRPIPLTINESSSTPHRMSPTIKVAEAMNNNEADSSTYETNSDEADTENNTFVPEPPEDENQPSSSQNEVPATDSSNEGINSSTENHNDVIDNDSSFDNDPMPYNETDNESNYSE